MIEVRNRYRQLPTATLLREEMQKNNGIHAPADRYNKPIPGPQEAAGLYKFTKSGGKGRVAVHKKKSSGRGIRTPDTWIMIPLL